jgi:hypothetical protein
VIEAYLLAQFVLMILVLTDSAQLWASQTKGANNG